MWSHQPAGRPVIGITSRPAARRRASAAYAAGVMRPCVESVSSMSVSTPRNPQRTEPGSVDSGCMFCSSAAKADPTLPPPKPPPLPPPRSRVFHPRQRRLGEPPVGCELAAKYRQQRPASALAEIELEHVVASDRRRIDRAVVVKGTHTAVRPDDVGHVDRPRQVGVDD